MNSNGIKRFIFWIQYDGSRFPEMARGGTGFGVMDILHQAISDMLYGPRPTRGCRDTPIRFSPSSRTDSGVHAIRNSIMAQIPLEVLNNYSTDHLGKEFVDQCNKILISAVPDGMKIHNIHLVADGFCIRRHVSYRRYTYRLAVCKNWELWNSIKENPSLACFSERHYSWILPPGLHIDKIREAASLFKGEQIMGSFFKHPLRQQLKKPDFPSTVKYILNIEMYKGEAFSYPNEVFDYYNISIVSKSFVREQIRRMMSCLVFHGYDRLSLSKIDWLLKNPIASNFFDNKIPIAPPNGLFLTDVVYPPEMFTNPMPYFRHSWDDDI